MKITCFSFLSIVILAACTCGGRTAECNSDNIKLSLLTNIHDDPMCGTISNKGVIIYEAAKLITDTHNENSSMKIDISIMDTCGSIAGTIKAAIKALVSTGLDCIHAPRHLGIIGPESSLNIDAVQKLTTVLNIPHIVKTRVPTSPYLHYLAEESEYYIVEGILKVIEALRWNKFMLMTRKYNDDDHDDDIQIIAKKVTMAAIAKGLCVITHDQDDIISVTSSQIVHIGMPKKNFFNNVNGTILIASEGSSTSYISKIDSTNSILFLEDSRNDFDELETRVINSKWWNEHNNENKYDSEELRHVRWLKDAINIFTTSLNLLCQKKKCSNEINSAEWNTIIANVIATHNAKAEITPKKMKLLLKNDDYLEKIGEISILNNQAELHWFHDNIDGKLNNKEIIPELFVEILSNTNDKSNINCAALTDITNKNNSDDVSQIIFATLDDHEWWTMVAIVGGIGVAMFTFGFGAVYIVYINIRGPKTLNNNRGGRRVSRDLSLRHVSSVSTPIHHINNSPTPPPLPPQRSARHVSRCDSTISDKSV